MDITKYEPEIQKAIKNFEETVKSIKEKELLQRNTVQSELTTILTDIKNLKTIIQNENQ